MKFMNMLEKNSALIGMVHCLPLPGTMNYAGSMDAIIEKAVSDAKTLEKAGFDAILTEPTLDLPSGMARGQLQLAAMSIICKAVSTAVSLPTGVSYLTPDWYGYVFDCEGMRSRFCQADNIRRHDDFSTGGFLSQCQPGLGSAQTGRDA